MYMNMKFEEFIKNNKRLVIFIPFFIVYIFVIELIFGAGMKNNSAWEKGYNRFKSNKL